MKKNKGFTLIEMLIVVAIVAILVAVAIPVMNNQLEKSREAADAANIRGSYSTILLMAIGNDDLGTGDEWVGPAIELKQIINEWQNDAVETALKNLGELDGKPEKGGFAQIIFNSSTEKVTIKFTDSNGSEANKSPSGKKWDSQEFQDSGKTAVNTYISNGKKSGIINEGQYDNDYERELAEQMKALLKCDNITIAYGTNGTIKNSNGDAILVSCVTENLSNSGNTSNLTAYRVFYDQKNGTVLSVWEQPGSWGTNDKGVVGFWGSYQKQNVLYE